MIQPIRFYIRLQLESFPDDCDIMEQDIDNLVDDIYVIVR